MIWSTVMPVTCSDQKNGDAVTLEISVDLTPVARLPGAASVDLVRRCCSVGTGASLPAGRSS